MDKARDTLAVNLVNEDNIEEDRINAHSARVCQGRMTETEKQLSVDAYPDIIRSFVSERTTFFLGPMTSFPMDGSDLLDQSGGGIQVLGTAHGMLPCLPDLFPSTPMTEQASSYECNFPSRILVEQLPPVTKQTPSSYTLSGSAGRLRCWHMVSTLA